MPAEVYIEKFGAKFKELSQDGNWEIRNEVLKSMTYISELIGIEKTHELIIPLIKERIDDLESDVQRKAFEKLFKMLSQNMLKEGYCNSDEFRGLFKHILQIINNKECPIENRHSLLKRIGPIIDMLDPHIYTPD